MRGISKTGLLLAIICLVGCAHISETEIFKEISKMEFFEKQKETGRVTFKPGEVNQLDLGQLQAVTIALLPVRSTMGGGLGEERVTKYLYEKLVHRFNNLKFINNREASNLFTEMEIWEDYFEYLAKYQQSSVLAVDIGELKDLFQQLDAEYILNINSDPAFIPKYPANFTVFVQVQVWDLSSGKMVWEGFGQGYNLVESPENLNRISEKVIERTCQRLAEELGTAPAAPQQATTP